ncbi:MAG: metal-dependent transcriptional regulator [Promethearchaeota archaeon]
MLDLDYRVLKEIYRSSKPLKVGEIAKKLSIPHSTVGSSIKRLEEMKYVVYKRYKPVSLSEKGEDLGAELTRHARLLELLLYNELNLNKEEAHNESEKFHLLFSCNTINKICEKYGHPKYCPCGEEIIDSTQCYCNDRI